MLPTSAAREVEGAETIDRYPEQWMFVVWRPIDRPLPFVRPDCWGHTIGQPWDAMAQAANGSPFLMLQEQNHLWSAWLEMALACDTLVPWYAAELRRRRDEQLAAERRRYVQWFGSSVEAFQNFMGGVLAGTPAVPMSSAVRPPMERQARGASSSGWVPSSQPRFSPDPNILRWRASPDLEGLWILRGSGSLELELIDGFGWPLERYLLAPDQTPRLCAALAVHADVQMPDIHVAFKVARRAFMTWHAFMAWLLTQANVEVQRLEPGLQL